MPHEDRPCTLPALLARACHGPDAPAVTDAQGTLDRAGLRLAVLALAGRLRGAGVQPGERVALWLPNCADYLAAILACAWLGVLAVHVNTRFRAAEVGSLLRRSRAVALVTTWGFAPVDFPAILAGLPPGERAGLRVVLGRALPAGVREVGAIPAIALHAEAPGDPGPDEATPEAPCLTFTTSGTTGGPKLVLHHQRTIASHAADVCAHLGLDAPDAALLGVVPFCGTFGNAALMAAVAGGAHVVCLEQFDGAVADALIRRHRVTHQVGSDDMLARLVAAAAGRPYETLRFSGFAAFQSSAAATVAAAELIGLAPCGVYGSSEVQALFAIAEGETRLLGGGVPVCPAARVVACDPQTGTALPPGTPGELWVDAPSRFAGYLDDEAATARATAPNGMFRTGDLGRVQGQGFVYEARLGDAMRLGGFLVAPEEIEGFLQAQPGVLEVQVVAATPPGGDPVPVAFVRALPGVVPDPAVLAASCRASLARFKQPGRIVVVDEFPTTDSPNGRKIQRVRLREMAEALLRGEAA